MGINIEVICTYVNLAMLMLFFCNLDSIYGHFIRFYGWLFVRCSLQSYIKQSRQMTVCSLNSQISPASKNRFTMKAPNP